MSSFSRLKCVRVRVESLSRICRSYSTPVAVKWHHYHGGPNECGKVRLLLQFPSKQLTNEYLVTAHQDTTDFLGFPCTFEKTDKGVVLDPKNPVEVLKLVLRRLRTQPNFDVTGRVKVRRLYKTLVEFGSPNIAKPLHMGHLRSAVTGNFIARINKIVGHDVRSFCFLGDWGTQFGILQAGLESSGISVPDVERMTLTDVTRFYVDAVKRSETDEVFKDKSRQFCQLLEDGDSRSVELWKVIRQKTVEKLNVTWTDLGIHFDVVEGESDYRQGTLHLSHALDLMHQKGLIQEDETGCKFTTIAKKAGKTARVNLVKADGTTLYLVRDVGAAVRRKTELGFDRVIYVVDNSQNQHFQALFGVMTQLKLNSTIENDTVRNFEHVAFGRVSGQSTRAGMFTLLSDVIDDGIEKMQQRRKKSPNTRCLDDSSISKNLAVSALIVASLKYRRNRDVDFDWDEALKSEGETAVNLQYNHARLHSLLTKHSEFKSSSVGDEDVNIAFILNDEAALDLVLHLANYEEALRLSYEELEPHVMLRYLFLLRDKVSRAFSKLSVKSEPDESIAASKLLLFQLSKDILSHGLKVLGITPLPEM